jgi:membrane protease YdiL (CAAX protease family)
MAGIFVAFLAPVFSWVMALRHLRQPGRWRWWLLGLAVFDTIMAVCLGLIVARGTPTTVAGPTGPRIGVRLNPEEPTLVQVVTLTPGGPAEQSGLRPGDRVLSVDDRAVPDNDDLGRTISATAAGTTRHLRIERGGQVLALDVTPVMGLASAPDPVRGLFEPVKWRGWGLGLHRALQFGLVEAAIVALVLLAARRRGNRELSAPLGVVAAFWLAALMAVLTVEILRRIVRLSLGVALLSWYAGSGSILVMGLLLARTRRSNNLQPPATRPLGTWEAIGLGILYYVAGSIRVSVVADAVAPGVLDADRNVMGLSMSWPPLGIALALILLVVVAPIGEELLFRGVLLPWIETWTTPSLAVLLSALVFAAGHLYYGAGMLIILVAGVVFGWARIRTGRLRASVALHMLLNITASTVFLLRR